MTPDKLAEFKRAIQALVTEAERNEAPDSPAGFAGEMSAPTLEHNVRKIFLNRMLIALGWKLETTVAEEARVRGDTTLFLDYLGVHLDTRIPLLIFEAKAWEKPFVSASTAAGGRQSSEDLIARALNYIKAGKNGAAPVTGEWIEWLSKLRDYVRTLRDQSHHVVGRVAISSGQWLVIFTEPAAAFLETADVNPANILVFQTDSFVRDSDHIFGQLSYAQLVADIPSPLRATQLGGFISANAVRRVFRALWARWEASGSEGVLDTFPQIIVYPAAILERADGVLLHVAEGRSGRQLVPPDATALKDHLDAVRQSSDGLLEAIFDQLEMRFDVSDLVAFPGFPVTALRGSRVGLAPEPEQRRVQFIRPWPDRAGEFLLVTGASSHFLLEGPTVDPCMWHNWAACQGAGVHVGHAPVIFSSVDPKCFYISGANHHCAHRGIHDRRQGNCYVAAFESFLCCRACVFQHICWPEGAGPAMPCGLSN
ncbi:hypothetical protein [Burkholderia cepacia]|uniref:hypothetical protein n=1 Tax=Burkholderia cepacia TaxID=292 RepID=UPI000F5A314F|nr:hypothetical protein [Burkholderia cepacia]RQT94076.1 hypothetical protein DF041_18055 [Burkholderia cepacia]